MGKMEKDLSIRKDKEVMKFSDQLGIKSDEVRALFDGGIKEVLVLHHNDTDGLSSAAILVRAFDRENIRVRRICLEKPYPEVVGELFRDSATSATLILIVDFGSGMLAEITQLANKTGRRVVVLDHHSIRGEPSALVKIYSPMISKMSGEECSASGVAFNFAVALNEWNRDLAPLAVLGALGDGLLRQGCLFGVNQENFEEALKGKGIDHEFYFKDGNGRYSHQELVSSVDALGSIGYFRGGPDIAVKGLADNDLYGMIELAKPYQAEFKAAFEECSSNISIQQTKHITWFNLEDRFEDFGVKTVGLFCQYLRDQGFVSESRYILGFQPIPAILPGLPILAPRQVKISMRVPNNLIVEIKKGCMPNLLDILPEASRALGGFVDACHPFAASTTIPIGSEDELIKLLEKKISTFNKIVN